MSIFICAGAVTLQRIGLSPLDMVIPLHRSATTTYYVKVILNENYASSCQLNQKKFSHATPDQVKPKKAMPVQAKIFPEN